MATLGLNCHAQISFQASISPPSFCKSIERTAIMRRRDLDFLSVLFFIMHLFLRNWVALTKSPFFFFPSVPLQRQANSHPFLSPSKEAGNNRPLTLDPPRGGSRLPN